MSTEGAVPSREPARFLVAVAGALARGAAPDDGVSALLGLALEAVGATGGAVFSRDPDVTGLALVARVGTMPDGEGAEAAGPTVEAALDGTATPGRPVTLEDRDGIAADLPLVVTRDGIELRLGALTIAWRGVRRPSDDDLGLLGAVADLIAVAPDRGRLASLAGSRGERAQQLAMMDALTGLTNARTLDRVLELEVARAGRQGSEICVALFDIDDFAALNGQAGRAAGDDALRRVASTLAASVRLVDTVARTGADEFVVVAPGSAGQAVAQRIVETISSMKEDGGPRVRVSAGIARFPSEGASPSELLDVARHALEAARAAGGGRVG